MFCKNCGKEIDNDSKFCIFCGTPQNTNKQEINSQNSDDIQNSENIKINSLVKASKENYTQTTNKSSKTLSTTEKIVISTIVVLGGLLFLVSLILPSILENTNPGSSPNEVKKEISITPSNEVEDKNTTKLCTNYLDSRYNDLSPSLYYSEMKSENLEYCDIAWHAKNSYGWDCEEITSLGKNISSSGNELGDALLKSEIKGYYQVATCTSGEQLRVYPRINTYPVITNKTGSFD